MSLGLSFFKFKTRIIISIGIDNKIRYVKVFYTYINYAADRFYKAPTKWLANGGHNDLPMAFKMFLLGVPW